MSSMAGQGNASNQNAVNSVGFVSVEGKQNNIGGSIACGTINANPSYYQCRKGKSSRFFRGERVIISNETAVGIKMEIGMILRTMDGGDYLLTALPIDKNQREIKNEADILKFNEYNMEKMIWTNERYHKKKCKLLVERAFQREREREREREQLSESYSSSQDESEHEEEMIHRLNRRDGVGAGGDEKEEEQAEIETGESDHEDSPNENSDYCPGSFIRSCVSIIMILLLLFNVMVASSSIESLDRIELFKEELEFDCKLVTLVCGIIIGIISFISLWHCRQREKNDIIQNQKKGANKNATFSITSHFITAACSAFLMFLIYKYFDEYFS